MKCPNCNGAGGSEAFINRGPDIAKHTIEWVRCRTCDGDGVVSEETCRRIAKGASMREARVARGETLREASRRLGVGPAELSTIEQGRGPADAYLDA